MESWLSANACYVSDCVRIKNLKGKGNSVVASEPISKGHTLVRIKKSLLLNKRTIAAKNSIYESLNAQQALALYIVLETESVENMWAPFLAELPTDFADVPLVQYVNESHALNSYPREIRDHVLKQAAKLQEDFNGVTCLDLPREILRSEYLTAWMCVNSRCLYMPNVPDNTTMAPYIDFFNHCVDEQDSVKVTFTASEMVVTANRAYDPGDELCLRYGPHDNIFLLCEYGFAIPDNPWDYVDVTPELEQLLTETQKQYLRVKGYYGEYTVNRHGPSFRTLVAAAASFCSQTSSVDAIINGVAEPPEQQTQGLLQPILDQKQKEYASLAMFHIYRYH